jgi:hypothetical protein
VKTEDLSEYDEKREKGTIKTSVYLAYFKTAVGYAGPITLLFLFVTSQFLLSAADYWLAYWYVTLKSA